MIGNDLVDSLTFGELYERTKQKEEFIKNAGYYLETIWESEWLDRIKLLSKIRTVICQPLN